MSTTLTPTSPERSPAPADGHRLSEKLRRGDKRGRRKAIDAAFRWFAIATATLAVLLLATLLTSILVRGVGSLNWNFVWGVPDPDPRKAGIFPAMAGTVLICAVCALTAIPIGVATAVLLEEFRPRNHYLKVFHGFVQLNITNLAGVPSLVYGLLGLTAFASMFGLFGTPISPAAELNARYYDQFLSSTGDAVLARVPSASAPPSKPTDVQSFFDQREAPLEVKVVSDMQQHVQPLQQRYTDFARSLQTSIENEKPAQLLSFVAAAWKEAGFGADLNAQAAELTPGLEAAAALKGRQMRKSLEEALKPAFKAELKRQLGFTIDAAAVPNRLTLGRDGPFYLRLPFGASVLAGGLTLMLVVLPIIIISSQEALRAVPKSLRMASLAMGATPLQTVYKVTLPSALPGIMTGVILSVSRAVGEAAPILILAGIVYITFIPHNLMDQFTAMPLQVYNWASRPQDAFYDLAAAGIILLLAVLISFNAIAIWIRQRTQRVG